MNLKLCKICGNVSTKNICSDECVKKFRVMNSHEKYPDGCDTDTYVECAICGYRTSELVSHLKIHKLTPKEYKETYNLEVKSQSLKDATKGDKNPGYQHGGTLSPFSKKFVNYKGDEYIEDLYVQSMQTRKENGNHPNTIEYYMNKGSTEEEARKIMYETYTFSLENCIRKHGEEEGIRIYNERQAKWQATLNAKPQDEKDDMNRRKSHKINYSNLWNNSLDDDGYFYIINLKDDKIKIGITSKDSINQRYSYVELRNKEILKFVKANSLNHAFQIEQLLKKKYKDNIKKDDYDAFGWTEVLNNVDAGSVINEVEELLKDPEATACLFENEFKNKDKK